MRNKSGEKTLVRGRNCLPPGVGFWQNRGNFFLSRERLNPRPTKSVAAREGELPRLTGLKPIKKGDRMKKSLIAVAVAGLFAAPAAMAEVTLSGAINVGITYLKSGAGTTSTSQTSTSLANNYSHIDIESVDDIGGGNKVIMHYQMQANPGSLGDTPTNRNSFLGLSGNWGSFRAGTNENVYERFMYESDPLDGAVGLGGNIQMLGHSGLQGPAWFTVGQTGGDQFWRRTDNTLMYYSPDLSGFTFEIEQTLMAHKNDKGVAPGSNPTITSLGGQFKPADAPFFANAAYEKHKDTCNSLCNGTLALGTSPKSEAWQTGGGFTPSGLNVCARCKATQDKATGCGVPHSGVQAVRR